MNFATVIAETYKLVEDDNVEGAVMGCLRLARHLKDYINVGIFLNELSSDNNSNTRCFLEDAYGLKEEAARKMWERARDYWIRERTLDFSVASDNDSDVPEDDQNRVFVISVGDINHDIEQCTRSIAELVPPAGMSPYDTAAFYDSARRTQARYRLRIQALHQTKTKVKARCFNYLVSLERDLAAQQKTSNFLNETQNQVQNYFKAQNEDVYLKLQKATQLVDTRDTEDYSLLLTEIRRAIKAVADHFYPAVTTPVKCADGKERVMDEEKYLNRLQEFIRTTFSKSSSKDLLEAEFEQLAIFARKLNDISSKGVHTNVNASEGKQGLLGLYMLLSNVVSKLQESESPTGTTAE